MSPGIFYVGRRIDLLSVLRPGLAPSGSTSAWGGGWCAAGRPEGVSASEGVQIPDISGRSAIGYHGATNEDPPGVDRGIQSR